MWLLFNRLDAQASTNMHNPTPAQCFHLGHQSLDHPYVRYYIVIVHICPVEGTCISPRFV
ncbi:hypothetical protein D3C85_808310 [compost metagenome]